MIMAIFYSFGHIQFGAVAFLRISREGPQASPSKSPDQPM